jgi:acetyl esterase/lipase
MRVEGRGVGDVGHVAGKPGGALERTPAAERHAGVRARVLVSTLLVAAILVTTGWAVTDVASPRAPSYEVPGPGSVIQDIVYSEETGGRLDLAYPSSRGPHPVIVWVHGGGWISGSKDYGVPDYLRTEIERSNAVTVAVDYRLAHRDATGAPVDVFPAAVYDVKTAVRFIKAHADEYDLDADGIVLAGASAGGHLAALAGTSAALGLLEPDGLPPALARVDSTVAAVVDVVGISDVAAWSTVDSAWAREPVADFLGCPAWTDGDVDCPADAYARASVAPYLSPLSPPAFLAYGGQDWLVPPAQQGRPLYDRWAAVLGSDAVVYDESPADGHELDGRGIDLVRLHAFLDGVYAGA